MKKLALALVATTAVTTANAEIRTGFYWGVDAAVNSLTTKSRSGGDHGDSSSSSSTTTVVPTTSTSSSSSSSWGSRNDLGRTRFGAGTYLGYDYVVNCMLYAGEIAFNWNNASVSHHHHHSGGHGHHHNHNNRWDFNFAGLVGFKFTPSTAGYIRIGGVWANNKGSFNFGSGHDHGSSSKVSFAPGLGVKTMLNRNIEGRLEWSYVFGNGNHHGSHHGHHASFKRANISSTKLGFAWKF